MKELPNFEIQPNGKISLEFIKQNIYTFCEATRYIHNLNYGRNGNKNDLKTIFIDNCGTCSTKHAVLKKLAEENNNAEIKLILGIFKMNSNNTSEIKETLKKNKLEYIPEAHNYLKYKDTVFDFTKTGSKPSDFENDLLEEIEILPNQITTFKIEYHKNYLRNWLFKNSKIRLNLNELWKIREECIRNLTISK